MIFRLTIALSVVLALAPALAPATGAQPRAPAEKFSPRPARTLPPQITGGALYSYSSWVKFCGREKSDPAAARVCLTVMEVKRQAGPFAAGAALIEGAGDKTVLRVTLPAEVKREAGARVAIDGETSRNGKFVSCNPRGCLADFDASAEFIARLKSGGTLHLSGTDPTGQATRYRLPLAGFAEANEGTPSALR
jgi:invasion protein IalB